MKIRTLRKDIKLLLISILLIGCCGNLWAAAPENIKVGLESIYKNVSSIKLSASTRLEIGTSTASGFSFEGILPAKTVIISKASGTYYDSGKVYATYDEAYQAAVQLNIGAAPVYVSQGVYKVYSTFETGNIAQTGKNRLEVKDEKGQLILVSEQNDDLLRFRGYDDTLGMSIIQVGQTKRYRGTIGIGGTSGLTPYNELQMQEYLYGVVPCEMVPSWPTEALKAQAVAARSIAAYQYKRYLNSGYNVSDTTATQAYGGYNAEKSSTNLAVDSTKGEMIYYKGSLAEAVYFSTSGGTTEDSENVWGNSEGYLKSVQDIYETEPEQKPWTCTMTLEDLNKCLKNRKISIGEAKGIQIISRTNSGRVQELCIIGTLGKYTLTGEAIRTFFSASAEGSLKSRLFSFNSNFSVSKAPNPNETTQNTLYNYLALTANGTQSLSLEGVMVMSQNDMKVLEENPSALTANGQMTLYTGSKQTSQKNEEPVTDALDGQVIYGDFTIYGKGFGHGVGMSQSGAKGMAKAGFSYLDILKFYYSGITVE